jgi:hypothetical protein
MDKQNVLTMYSREASMVVQIFKLSKWRQEDCEFEDSLSYIVRTCLKRKNKNPKSINWSLIQQTVIYILKSSTFNF